MADATKATARPSVTWPIPRLPAVCEKNIFHLIRYTQPVENYPYNIFILGASFEGNQCVSSSTLALTCSRRSDSGERCKVKKEMKSRGETLLLPLPRFYFFTLLFTSHRSLLSKCLNRLPRHSLSSFLGACVCVVSIDIHWRVTICWGVESFELLLNPFQETQRCHPLNKAKFPLNIIS